MLEGMKRRQFLATVPVATAAATAPLRGAADPAPPLADRWGDLLPRRTLGRTGESVTMLGVGGFHVGWTAEKDGAAVIEAAMEGGVRFFDTAESYQQGESERRYGKYLVPEYRGEVFLMTKTTARDAKTAREHLEGSLRRLNTEYLDLYQIHSLRDPDDVDNRLANGVLDVLLEAKAAGKVRHIGFTGHSNPEAHLRMLEQTRESDPFDTCQMPVNAIDPQAHSFIKQVLPMLQERNIALLAMKTLADGRFFALKRRMDRVQWQTENPVIPTRLSVRDALAFAWSQPISTLITGAENASLLREKIDFARAFRPLTEAERVAMVEALASFSEADIEYYKRPLG